VETFNQYLLKIEEKLYRSFLCGREQGELGNWKRL
jgi:hypothetical protein